MDPPAIVVVAFACCLGSCATQPPVAPAAGGPAAVTSAVLDPAEPAGQAAPSAGDGGSPVVTPESGAVESSVPPALPAGSVEFEDKVLPILQAKCSPCHFPGGKMYQRLPFDRQETIRFLGTDLFTRLKDEGDQATIRSFLNSPPPAPAP
jgi:hypothetical protein